MQVNNGLHFRFHVFATGTRLRIFWIIFVHSPSHRKIAKNEFDESGFVSGVSDGLAVKTPINGGFHFWCPLEFVPEKGSQWWSSFGDA